MCIDFLTLHTYSWFNAVIYWSLFCFSFFYKTKTTFSFIARVHLKNYIQTAKIGPNSKYLQFFCIHHELKQ